MNLKYYLRGLGIGIVVSVIIMFVITSKSSNTLTDSEIKERAKSLGMVETGQTLADIGSDEETKTENAPVEEVAATTNETPSEAENKPEDETGNTDPKNEFLDEVEQQLDEANQKLEEIRNKDDAEQTSEEEPKEDIKEEPKTEEAKVEEPKTEEPKTEEPETEEVKVEKNQKEAHTPETQNSGDKISFTINKGDSSFAVAKKLVSLNLVSDAYTYDSYLCSNGMDRRIHAGDYSIPADSSEEDIALYITGQKR